MGKKSLPKRKPSGWHYISQAFETATARRTSLRHCLARGTFHQGDLNNSGQQCVGIAMEFLACQYLTSDVTFTLNMIDRILQEGDELYKQIAGELGVRYLMITEIAAVITTRNEELGIAKCEPYAGTIGTRESVPLTLTYTMTDALDNTTRSITL